jgi:hypothetical protein
MQKPSLFVAIEKLAVAGEQARFSLEEMIGLLNGGLSVETLLDLISWRLQDANKPMIEPDYRSGWVL